MRKGFHNTGFTLVELLVVISIIGLLSSIVLAALQGTRNKANVSVAQSFNANIWHSMGDTIGGSWNFDACSGSTVADATWNNVTGTLVNSPSFSATNTPFGTGCSLKLDGSSQYVNFGSPTNLDLSGPFTVSVWLKPNNIGVGLQEVVSRESSGKGYYIWWNSTVGFGMNSGANEIQSIGTLDITKWHLVTGTYNGTNLRLYIDGVLNQTGGWSMAPIPTGSTVQLLVGKYPGGGSYFGGYIDDLSFYNSALSDAQVREIYAATAPQHDVAILGR